MTQKFPSTYLTKRTEDMFPIKNLYANVYSSFIHNCQNLGTTEYPQVENE